MLYLNHTFIKKDFSVEEQGKRKTIQVSEMKSYNLKVGDIGEKTIKAFKSIIMKSKTNIITGTLGIIEKNMFFKGSKEITSIMVKANKKNNATTIIGDELEKVVETLNINHDVSLITRNIDVVLEILSGKEIPLVKALRERIP